MSRPGLSQGFVLFGSVAHRILVALHELGDMRLRDLDEELTGVDVRSIAIQLTRLNRHGLVYRRGMASTYDTGDHTQFVHSLRPPPKLPRWQPADGSARSRIYRARRSRRVPSVFDWRASA